jgi:hypothetical protein
VRITWAADAQRRTSSRLSQSVHGPADPLPLLRIWVDTAVMLCPGNLRVRQQARCRIGEGQALTAGLAMLRLGVVLSHPRQRRRKAPVRRPIAAARRRAAPSFAFRVVRGCQTGVIPLSSLCLCFPRLDLPVCGRTAHELNSRQNDFWRESRSCGP